MGANTVNILKRGGNVCLTQRTRSRGRELKKKLSFSKTLYTEFSLLLALYSVNYTLPRELFGKFSRLPGSPRTYYFRTIFSHSRSTTSTHSKTLLLWYDGRKNCAPSTGRLGISFESVLENNPVPESRGKTH